jgi:LysR family carnitine catabolism transcriptional activator
MQEINEHRMLIIALIDQVLMAITIRRLQSFITVAELGGFRRAAEELALSQPALSAHIQELERFLGVPLLRRTTRKVQLTSDGTVFLARTRRALAELDAVVAEIEERAAIQRGRISVASVPSISANVLPRILAEFTATNPGITVEIDDDRAEIIEGRVERSEVDFAIGPAPEHSTDLAFKHIVDDPFLAIFPRNHALATKTTVSLKDFVRYPIIAMRTGLNMRSVIDNAFAKSKIFLRPRHEVNHHETLTGMVESGFGVGMLPALTISIMHHPLLASALIVKPTITRQIGIIQRRGEPLSPVASQFADTLSERFVELIQTPVDIGKSMRLPKARSRGKTGA